MSPAGELGIFYQNDKVQTLLQADRATTVVSTPQTVLAQCSANALQAATMLLGTDQQASPLSESDPNGMRAAGYTPYGLESALQGCLGFTGQLRAGGLHGYLLGNGYRFYDPMLMRFYSPDALSPFSMGGLNCYAYCSGDPVNFSDPTGHMKRVHMASSTVRSRSRSPQRVASRSPSPVAWEDLMRHPGWDDPPQVPSRPNSPNVLDQMMAHPGWPGTPATADSFSGISRSQVSLPDAATTTHLEVPASSSARPPAPTPRRERPVRVFPITRERAEDMISLLENMNPQVGGRSIEESKAMIRSAIDIRVAGGNVAAPTLHAGQSRAERNYISCFIARLRNRFP